MTMVTGTRYRNAKITDLRLELSTTSHFSEKTLALGFQIGAQLVGN
jgi:hypothetical protein